MIVRTRTRNTLDEMARRVFDVVVSVAALVLLSPLLAAVALAVKLESRGPILFVQTRLGRNGRHFSMFKFRKFHAACNGGSALTLAGDARLTRVGRVLVATKLDELPQFWNVLTGDMAIIGPRPESLAFADCFEGPFRRVLEHKPGILGPSQVVFRNESVLYAGVRDPAALYREVIFPTKARIDLDYFESRSLVGDIGWILRGVQAVLGIEGARSRQSAAPVLANVAQRARAADGM